MQDLRRKLGLLILEEEDDLAGLARIGADQANRTARRLAGQISRAKKTPLARKAKLKKPNTGIPKSPRKRSKRPGIPEGVTNALESTTKTTKTKPKKRVGTQPSRILLQ